MQIKTAGGIPKDPGSPVESKPLKSTSRRHIKTTRKSQMQDINNRGLRLARPAAVAAYMGLGLSTLWDWASNKPGFPPRIRIGQRITLWDLDLIDAYVRAGVAA